MKCATPNCNNQRQRRHQHCAECATEAKQQVEVDLPKIKARILAVIEREERWGLYDRTGKKPRA